MDVIDHGYVIPLNDLPMDYEEENNGSARKNMEFVRKTVRELQEKGVVKFVEEKPKCVSPLTVAEQDKPGGKKLRLCLDASRCVNPLLQTQKVTLSHLSKALEVTKEGDFQVKYDLTSAYHHIKISDSQIGYLGAAFTKEDGSKQYFVFLYLPFGLGSAVHCMTKIFKPLNAYFHSLGIRHSIFIDDGRILSATPEGAENDRKVVYETLKKAGWTVEEEKSDGEGEASQIKEYLGFIIDTHQMSVRIKEDKKVSVKKEIQEILLNKNRRIHAKELAKITGRMVSLEPAMGGMPLMAARAAYIQIEQAVEEFGWNGSLKMSEETILGLEFFLENMDQFDNSPIRTAATEVSVLSIVGPPGDFIKTGFVANHVTTEEDQIWASDASGFATCAYSVTGDNLYFRGLLNRSEQRLSSGHRELLAVRQSLEYYASTWEERNKPLNINWLSDSENLVKFLKKGSGKSHIQRDIFRVMQICQEMKIRIIPIHLRREDPRIKLADSGSKVQDTDDWSVDFETFERLNNEFQFTIDLFATDKNSKCERFYSNFYCPGTWGIDAFAHCWDGEVAWICPPIKDIPKIVQKIKAAKMAGLLYIPEWPTSDFWLEIFGKKGELLPPFRQIKTSRPFLIQKEFDSRSPFSGRAKFNFLEIAFVST